MVGVKSSISNNVGGVKQFSSALRHALGEERHFALVEGCAFKPKARSQSLRSGTQSDPTISSITNRDHDYYFELPCEGERDAQSLRR
jgi:hypothetical protein